jgi:uncharacterized protein DUF2381
MSCLRGILVGLALVAATAQAEEVASHVRAGVWRAIAVPLVEGKGEPGPVPELHVAPGSATLVSFPVPITGPDGFKVSGGEGRVDAQQVNATTLVLVPLREIGPERIPLAVATADGRRYPFLLVTKPDVVDLEVQVVHFDNTRPIPDCRGGDEIVEALLHHVTIFSRQYQRTQPRRQEDLPHVDWDPPFVESAVRVGSRYVIQISNYSHEPWKVEQAKLQGATGEILRVQGIRWRMEETNWNLNVVIAEVPEGASADFALRSIELVGEDARVASLDQKVALP